MSMEWKVKPCGHKLTDTCIEITMSLDEFKKICREAGSTELVNLCKEVEEKLKDSHIGW